MKNNQLISIALLGLFAFAASAQADEPPMNDLVKRRMSRAAMTPDTLQNPDFEENISASSSSGWSVVTHAGDKYRVELDGVQAFSGKHSLIIENEANPSWGGAIQSFRVGQLAGREVEFSAQVKTQGVTAPGFRLALKVTQMGRELVYIQTQDGTTTGDTDWKKIILNTKLPSEATHLEVKLILDGDGRAWVDDLHLEPLKNKE